MSCAPARGRDWTPTGTRDARARACCAPTRRRSCASTCGSPAWRCGSRPSCMLAPYGQLEQELLGADTALARFAPTHVLIAPTTADLGFPELGRGSGGAISARRCRAGGRCGTLIRGDLGARVAPARVRGPRRDAARTPVDAPAGQPGLARARAATAGSPRRPGPTCCSSTASGSPPRIGKRALDRSSPVVRRPPAVRRTRRCRCWRARRRPCWPPTSGSPRVASSSTSTTRCGAGSSARRARTGIAIGDGPDGEAYAAFQEYLLALGGAA